MNSKLQGDCIPFLQFPMSLPLVLLPTDIKVRTRGRGWCELVASSRRATTEKRCATIHFLSFGELGKFYQGSRTVPMPYPFESTGTNEFKVLEGKRETSCRRHRRLLVPRGGVVR